MTDETIGNVPILILGNKIDRQEAISEEKLREGFGLYGQTTGKVRTQTDCLYDYKDYTLEAHLLTTANKSGTLYSSPLTHLKDE